MGRPHSLKGPVMKQQIEDARIAISLAESHLLKELQGLTIEPTDWAACSGRVLAELRAARIAMEQMDGIVEANKKNGAAEDLPEQVADLCHEQWSGWMRYLFGKSMSNMDGSCTIPASFVRRWKQQASTTYAELSKAEKDSDRREAAKFLRLLAGGDT